MDMQARPGTLCDALSRNSASVMLLPLPQAIQKPNCILKNRTVNLTILALTEWSISGSASGKCHPEGLGTPLAAL
jgi:hypothetical protein